MIPRPETTICRSHKELLHRNRYTLRGTQLPSHHTNRLVSFFIFAISFKIIQTIEGNKKKLFTVPSGWEIDNILRYPNKAPSKYIKDENSKPTPEWEIMKCTVKRINISSYEAGDKQISEMMKYSDTDETDDDNRLQPRRPHFSFLNMLLNGTLLCTAHSFLSKPCKISLVTSMKIFDELDANYYCKNARKLCTESMERAPHVVCKYHDLKGDCSLYKYYDISESMAREIVSRINQVRSNVANGKAEGQDGYLPRGYGMMRVGHICQRLGNSAL
ncbi:hypothetical protein SFRURICE_005791 [Spodoptera frugiperda]|nr:hypothetical protein SFRURICE_005791 [Spodoptera frugiperda]